MWVFDGEEWVEEGTSSKKDDRKLEYDPRNFEEFQPELQIIEVPLTRHEPKIVPLFPIP